MVGTNLNPVKSFLSGKTGKESKAYIISLNNIKPYILDKAVQSPYHSGYITYITNIPADMKKN